MSELQQAIRGGLADLLRGVATAIDMNGAREIGHIRVEIPEPKPMPRKPKAKTNAVDRHGQVLDLLRINPQGLSGTQIGRLCGMKGTTQVYGVLRRLERDGLAVKRDGLWTAV